MVICLERGADLHMAQLMPLPPTVSCFSKIQIGFTFLVPAHLGSPGKMCVCVCACVRACVCARSIVYRLLQGICWKLTVMTVRTSIKCRRLRSSWQRSPARFLTFMLVSLSDVT